MHSLGASPHLVRHNTLGADTQAQIFYIPMISDRVTKGGL